MSAADFHQPIHLFRESGEMRIASATDAYEALTGNWPASRGKCHAAARACQSAASGETSPHIARRMFMYAASEARVSAR